MKLKLWHSALKPQYDKKIHPKTLSIIDKWITLNPDIEIERNIFSDDDCINFLDMFDKKYGTTTVKFFQNEYDGRFKSDLWRLCVLYEHGGMYVDIDQEPLEPIHKYLNLENIDFCCAVNPPSNYLCNGFIYVKNEKSETIKKCIDVHLNKYKQKETSGIDGDMAGVHTMYSAISNIFEDKKIPEGEININDEKFLFLSEYPNWKLPNNTLEFIYSYGFYRNELRVMNSRYFNYFTDKTLTNEFVSYEKNQNFNN